MKSIAMFGTVRPATGKTATKKLRATGQVPCVLYGGDQHIHFAMYEPDFKLLVYTPNAYQVKLDIDGTVYKCILKDIQFHPVNESIMHADFLQIHDDKPVVMNIPVKIVGNSVGVRAGGKLIVKAKKLRVKALPAKFPDFIEVNVEHLEIGKSIKVGDLKLDGIQLLDSPNNPIVSVNTTRAVMEAAKAEEKAAKKK
jgi:large subunit ribosomal protein L25